MPLDPRIALGGQSSQIQFRDPIASYNQLAQLTSADTQNRLAQMQMQEHEQMAPYRMQEAKNKAASAQLTYDQAKQAQDFITSVMTKAAEHPESPQDPIEAAQQMLMHPNPQVQAVGGHLLDASQKVMTYKQQALFLKDQSGGEPTPAVAPKAEAAPAVQTFDTSATMTAPIQKPLSEMSNAEKILYNEWTGRNRQPQPSTVAYTVDGQQVPFNNYVNANIANSAGVGEKAAMAAMPNKLAPAAVTAPVANAMVAPSAAAPTTANLMSQITSGDRKYGEAKGWLAQRALLVEQFKELAKNPLARIDPKDYTPDSFAAYMQTGDASKLLKAKDERLAFDQAKFEWEKANPGKEIKEVTQGGVAKYFAIDKRTGESTPVTVAGGKVLTGTDMASQRLAFDQSKFAWEKANPGFTIQQTEDGSIVGVNNRTLQAYPVTLNAGTPPPPAPFTGVSGAAPSAGGGRGAVGVTDNRVMPNAPAGVPAGAPTVGMPLKGKAAGLTESQGNATAFGMRMKQSHDLLTNLEKSGTTDTGIVRGIVGGTLGLTPLIGDKLNDATGNIFNALPTVLGGLNEQQQQTVNARINFITALLRKESGAAIGPSEFSTAEKLYFPKPGDPKSVIEQKQRARELAIQAMKIQAGPGAKNIGAAQGEGATDELDPLGIRK
jgi:hypothetical protein